MLRYRVSVAGERRELVLLLDNLKVDDGMISIANVIEACEVTRETSPRMSAISYLSAVRVQTARVVLLDPNPWRDISLRFQRSVHTSSEKHFLEVD